MFKQRKNTDIFIGTASKLPQRSQGVDKKRFGFFGISDWRTRYFYVRGIIKNGELIQHVRDTNELYYTDIIPVQLFTSRRMESWNRYIDIPPGKYIINKIQKDPDEPDDPDDPFEYHITNDDGNVVLAFRPEKEYENIMLKALINMGVEYEGSKDIDFKASDLEITDTEKMSLEPDLLDKYAVLRKYAIAAVSLSHNEPIFSQFRKYAAYYAQTLKGGKKKRKNSKSKKRKNSKSKKRKTNKRRKFSKKLK